MQKAANASGPRKAAKARVPSIQYILILNEEASVPGSPREMEISLM